MGTPSLQRVCVCVCVCVCVQYPTEHFCICSISTCIIQCAQVRVWSCLVTDSLVYLLKLLYVDSCVVGSCMA